jgi:hypothetical protein
VVGILAYCARGRGFDLGAEQIFVCMSVCIGSRYLCIIVIVYKKKCM